MLRYVTIEKFSQLSGYTEAAVRSKINGGVWMEGVQYKRAPDSRILIDVKEFERWVENQGPVSKPSPPRYGSRFNTKADVYGRHSE